MDGKSKLTSKHKGVEHFSREKENKATKIFRSHSTL